MWELIKPKSIIHKQGIDFSRIKNQIHNVANNDNDL